MEENHILRPSSVFGKSVSTAVQYSGFIDCRKFSWQQCTGCRQLVGKSHLSDGRLFQRYRNRCRGCDCPLFWSQRYRQYAAAIHNNSRLGSCFQFGSNGARRSSGTSDSDLDGYTGECSAAVGNLFPHLFYGLSGACHVQHLCGHPAGGR